MTPQTPQTPQQRLKAFAADRAEFTRAELPAVGSGQIRQFVSHNCRLLRMAVIIRGGQKKRVPVYEMIKGDE